MTEWNLPRWPPADKEIEAALAAVWRDGSWGKYHGNYVGRLEQQLCDFHQLPAARTCASGTVAVELGLVGLGVRAGDEVILSAYDFPGNYRCVEKVGARPVLVGIDPSTGCLDARLLDEACSEATTAVIVSHLHGALAPMQRICQWASQHGVAVLEDACQAPGALVDGRLAGTWGDVATFSFGGSKLLTAGRGGAVLTRHPECRQRMKVYAERGNDAYPLSELQAAVLLPQLQSLGARNAQRQQMAMRLRTALAEARQLRWVGAAVNAAHRPSYYKVGFAIDEGTSRERWLAVMQGRGIDIAAGFPGFTRRSDRRCRKVGDMACARLFAEQIVVLHHPLLLADEAQLQQVARQLGRDDCAAP